MKLERVQQLNEATIEYVMNFMAKPAKLWRDSDLESRKAFQEILFPNGLHIDIKGRKCGTEDLSPLFSVMNTKKRAGESSNYSCGDLCGSNASHFLSASIIKKQNKFFFLTLSLKDRT